MVVFTRDRSFASVNPQLRTCQELENGENTLYLICSTDDHRHYLNHKVVTGQGVKSLLSVSVCLVPTHGDLFPSHGTSRAQLCSILTREVNVIMSSVNLMVENLDYQR